GVRVTGAVTADPGLIIANSGLVVGKEVKGEDIQKAIRRIWGLNLFSNVEILLEREVADGGFFLIQVQEYPRLERIELSGNKKVKDDEIEELLNLYKGQVLRPARVQRAKQKLLDTYHEKGYLLAEVEMNVLDTDDPMKKVLEVKVHENKKVRIKRIEFSGNTAFKDRILRKQLKKTKQRGFLRSGSFDPIEYEADLDNLVAFYRNHGYRDAEVLGDSIYYTEDRKRMILRIDINEGNLYKFGEVSFEGNRLFTTEELLAQLAFKPGDEYSEEKLTLTTAQRLGDLYYDRGYIYSRINPLLVPRGTDTLDVHFQISEGNQFKVRKINVIGNSKTKEKVIRREIVLYPGETFDVSKLRRSVRELTILNYFSNITPDVIPVSEDEVDLLVDVEEKPTDQASLSAGYSERDGIIGAVGFAMPNFLGNGQRFSLDWNFGQIYRSFSISFTEPWMFNTPTLGGVSFFDLRRGGTFYGFDENVTGGSIRIGRRFKWPDDYTRGDWIYKLERALYSNFSQSFKETNPRELQEGVPRWSSSLTQIITRDSRDNPEFPSRGSVFSYSVELAGSVFGGDDQYHKHSLSMEWYFPINRKLVLYSQTRTGLLFSLSSDPSAIPYIDYFFMGGSGISFGESLRGYEERSVGPQTVVGGYAVGGTSLFKQSIELRVPLIPNPTVFGLVFAEAGNTWLTRSEMDLSDLRRSMGVGVRLFMPFIGLIGLDYGYGFDYVDSSGRRSGRWVPAFQFGRTF
ncbi:MAG TPA: outer membrane protein assembly factor BamA, partial [Bacteroidetes bacterium]|nr:outer membrane protein assembly factor BamA [Bacteroidota bacterium]